MPLKQTLSRAFIALGCALVLIAALLLLHNAWAEQIATQGSASALTAIAAQQVAQTEQTEQSDTLLQGLALQATISHSVDLARLTATTLTVDEHSYCGVLEIACLGLSLPIQSEFSYTNLKTSPCVYQEAGGEALVLAAHNYTAHFGTLPQLTVGDAVTYTPIDGQTVQYTVTEITTVDETTLEAVVGSEGELILFTCNSNNNSQRVIVRCVQTNAN